MNVNHYFNVILVIALTSFVGVRRLFITFSVEDFYVIPACIVGGSTVVLRVSPFTTSTDPICKGALVTIPSTFRICIAVARAVACASSAGISVLPVKATNPKKASLLVLTSAFVLGNTEIVVSEVNEEASSSR